MLFCHMRVQMDMSSTYQPGPSQEPIVVFFIPMLMSIVLMKAKLSWREDVALVLILSITRMYVRSPCSSLFQPFFIRKACKLYYETDPNWVHTLKIGYEVRHCDIGRKMHVQEKKIRKRKSDAAESLLQ